MGSQGPADEFAKDLAKGDFKKAAEQLKKLQEKLQSGKMTEAEKKALKEQLGEMAKKLNDLANLEQRKKQLEEARKNGGLSEQQYEREMEKLNEQSKSLKQLQQLASKLGKAQEALQKGDTKKAAESLGMTQQQLARDGQAARGDGVARQRHGRRPGRQERHDGRRHEPARRRPGQLGHEHDGMRKGMGNGLGRGRGQGDRPEAPDETATYTTKVQQQIEKGKAVAPGLHHAGQDRQGGERHRHPGRDRSRHRPRRRSALQPEDPQERREAHPGVLTTSSTRGIELEDFALQNSSRHARAASGCRGSAVLCLKIETVPVDCETQTAIESVVTVMAAAASCRVPSPWGSVCSSLLRGAR